MLCRWKGMINAKGCESLRNGENLLGLLEYYEAILDRNGLAARIGELRSIKLGLLVDLLKTVNVPEDLKADLITAVISAWRMNSKDKTLQDSEEELKTTLCSIETVRRGMHCAGDHFDSMSALKQDLAVMFALPLKPCDLKTDEVSRIQDLLSRVMDHFAAGIEGGFGAVCREWRFGSA
jgi:hypothetical protein